MDCFFRIAAGGVLLVLLSAPIPLLAQQGVQPAGADSVSLDFRDTDIRMVITALAEMAGMNVVYSNLPSTPVTLRSTIARSDARRTLESLVRGSGLKLTDDGGLIRVESAAPAPSRPSMDQPSGFAGGTGGGAGSGEAQLFVYRVRHSEADALANTLRELFGLGARASTGGGSEGSGPLSRELARQRIPLPGEDTQGPPRPVSGGTMLGARLSSSVQIVPDARTNSLLIRGSSADYQTVLAAVQQLDIRPLQVLIEVLIVEVRRTRDRALGVTLGVPDQREPQTGAQLGGTFTGGSTGDLVVRVLGLGGVRADVVIRALAQSGDVSILSRPIILAQNNQQARFLVGDQRPFIQVSRTLPTDAATRDEVIQYRDVGTELTITPTINPDGYVTLDVLQEVSNASRETQFGAPIINTREAETRLMVKDQHTAIIGGLIRQQDEYTATGIPILRDIPLIGRLFRSSVRTKEHTELFLLLTPRVLRTDEDMDDATRTVEEDTRGVGKALKSYEPLFGTDRPLRPRPDTPR